MGLQEEMAEYIEEEEENLNGIEDDVEEFFSEIETQESAFSKEADSSVVSAHEWVARTETSPAQRRAREKYEQWYTAIEPLVYQYLPRRCEEFEEMHSKMTNYINLDSGIFESVPEDPMERAIKMIDILDGQRSIAKAAPKRVAAERFNARKEISAQVEEDEIIRARRLFEDDLIRASGVIAGVALERRLLTMCETSERDIDYDPNHSIDRLAQSLYDADEIQKTPMKHLKHLGGIRGDCAHPGKEPNPDDVERLINDAEEYIREGFEK
jgi:hypothetical protein